MTRRSALLILCLFCAATAPSAQVKKNTPLTIREQGSFFVVCPFEIFFNQGLQSIYFV